MDGRVCPESGSCGFSRSRRLTTAVEFTSVLRQRRTARSSAHFELLYCSRAVNELGEAALNGARLGMVIAKRFARTSVMRNLLKRLIREAFRQKQVTLPNCDVILRLRKRIDKRADREVGRQQFGQEIDALLTSLL